MIFHPTTLADARVIELEPIRDPRGFFARTFCVEEFTRHGLEAHYPQHSITYTANKGSVRGMHFQSEPHGEAKLVRCTRGAIWDVIIDIRHGSPTYRRWQHFELVSGDGKQLYVPKGFAHGLQTLCDDVEVSYLISTPYEPQAGRGIRHDDSAFGIRWPLPVSNISEKDLNWPSFTE